MTPAVLGLLAGCGEEPPAECVEDLRYPCDGEDDWDRFLPLATYWSSGTPDLNELAAAMSLTTGDGEVVAFYLVAVDDVVLVCTGIGLTPSTSYTWTIEVLQGHDFGPAGTVHFLTEPQDYDAGPQTSCALTPFERYRTLQCSEASCPWLGDVGLGATNPTQDPDGDGHATADGDCDEDDPYVHPGASEVCDAVDSNCDGYHDEDLMDVYWRDADGDAYGDDSTSEMSCEPAAGYVPASGTPDCDDTNADIHPGAEELCDDLDNDCDDEVDEDCPDDTAARR